MKVQKVEGISHGPDGTKNHTVIQVVATGDVHIPIDICPSDVYVLDGSEGAMKIYGQVKGLLRVKKDELVLCQKQKDGTYLCGLLSEDKTSLN